MNTAKCPECQQELSTSQMQCACGWQCQNQSQNVVTDMRCQYEVNGKNCLLPGTICTSPYSTLGPWHCREHWMK